jgi:hypothetical protein
MDNTSSERRYEMQDHPLFDPKSSKADLRRTLSDGIVVEAHVEGERIVGYTAYDASGRAIAVRRMQLTETTEIAGDADPRMERRCWYCICNGSCKCWPEPCPQ